MPARLSTELAALSLLSTLALPSHAIGTFDYGADVGVGETDNVTLVQSNKLSQTMAIADVDFALKDKTRFLDAEAKGDFSELDYLQGAYASELVGRFDGTARYAFVPEKISWTVQEHFGQVALDPFLPVTPLNRENINYVSTGPNLDLRLGGVGFLDATLRYVRSDYQVSPFSSNRFLGDLALGRLLSARSSVSINVASERALFENTQLNTDFTRSSVYAAYELHGERTKIEADLGLTRVDSSSSANSALIQNVPTGQIPASGRGPTTQTGGLGKLSVERLLSPSSKLTLAAGQNLTDASTNFSTLQPGALATTGTSPAAVTSANYKDTYTSIVWQYLHHRTSIALSAQWEKDSYAGLPQLDLDRETAQLNATRQLTGVLAAQLIGSVYRTRYSNGQYAETDGIAGVGLVLRRGRWLELKLRIDHDSRTASGLGAQGYSENRAFLLVGYRPATNPSAGMLPVSLTLSDTPQVSNTPQVTP
ncbi:MAG TPA: hypothetical protein VKT22_12970 [Steroidobacteraceae bacterium]|nr:hypothetical protein [Steroidobacteraceae bacterium]